jgi:hypothetical protein
MAAMYRLSRMVFSTAILLVVAYFAVTVPIGKYTLWGHLVRIARSPEAQDLATGAKETAKDAARRAQRELEAQKDGPATIKESPAAAREPR